MEHLLVKATVTQTADKGTFTAVISTASLDRDGDIVEPAAVVAALQKWAPTGKLVPLSWNHSTEAADIIGHIDPSSARIENDEVVVEGWVDQATEVGKQAWRLVKSGVLGFSYGYLVPQGGAVPIKGGGERVTALDIFEITATPIPSNGETRVLSFKAAGLRKQADDAALEHAAGDLEKGEPPKDDEPSILAWKASVEEALPDWELADLLAGNVKAVWSGSYINDLPDSSFLYIEDGGEKDDQGKTTPRSLRHFPVRDANGVVDLPHLRNALARIPQSALPQDVKDRAAARARQLLDAQKSGEVERKETGIDVSAQRKTADREALEFASGLDAELRRKAPEPPPDEPEVFPAWEVEGAKSGQLKAAWTSAYIDGLPDASFLHVEPGGTLDRDGKTVPRANRYFPVKDADGAVDKPHVRSALARIPQSNLPQDVKDRLAAQASRMLDDSKSVDVADKDASRSVDPLRKQAESTALEFASDGLSLRQPPRHASPSGPDRLPELSLAQLRQRMRDEILMHITGEPL